MTYPKRLIEVDLPIKRISAHARREKSIRHGHISTLHIWWARRPLAACRAVICASLWIDPVDELCPQVFRDKAAAILTKFAEKAVSDRSLHDHCSPESLASWKLLTKPEMPFDTSKPQHLSILRYWLLDFIADFANWDNSTQPDYLETARALTQVAHEALGGEVGTRPLVVDPFAGGGSIPLEALRVGADAFASDLNPVAVLLNKVVLEYIPKYGQRLADEVRKWGKWVKEEAEKELAEFYPKDEDGSTPIAYLWARTIISEAPDDGAGIPVEVPLMRSLWLAKKAGRYKALRWVRDTSGVVQTEVMDVTYADGLTRKVRRPLLEIFEPKNEKEVEKGTVARGSGTCPVTGFTTLVESVKRQLKARHGGSTDSRLISIVTLKKEKQGRVYRLPDERDITLIHNANTEILKREQLHNGNISLFPDESTEHYHTFVNRGSIYGMTVWKDYFTQRQLLALSTFAKAIKIIGEKIALENENSFAKAIQTCLALAIDRQSNTLTSLSRWDIARENIQGVFARQAIPMVWDFTEANSFSGATGGLEGAIDWVVQVCEKNSILGNAVGQVELTSATTHPLPDDSASFFCTDPPYYFSVQYADLADFFYVWLKRMIADQYPDLFKTPLIDSSNEIIVQSPGHEFAKEGKNNAFYESQMQVAMSEGRRILSHDGIGLVVFAHTSTRGWEAQLQAMVNAGWTITGSWSIDTEMANRVIAQNRAVLASSVHLVCRPRSNNEIGDWRDVLQELPKRIKEWMPRLTEQGVVGADAIFACLGPALEIFSRYSSVEKASGEIVPLREYLEYVWAAISKEALSTIFKDADTSNFEEDARLTAMWLWTLSADPSPNGANTTDTDKISVLQEDETDDDDEENTGKKAKVTGFSLEYDAARKIAQGLGAHLETLTHLVEVKGDKARLLPVKERAAYLFGKEGITPDIPKKKAKGDKQLTITGILAELPEDEHGEIKISRIGETVCDKVHQAMLLFNSGRSEALKRFLVDEGIGNDTRFWQLAQSFSALYPAGTDEKRWVDGLLARKKGLGL